MDCSHFLDRYSEYRDGLITARRELAAFRAHLAGCARCRRYDAMVRRSALALQAASEIAPSTAFRRRLDARLAQEQRGVGRGPLIGVAGGIAAALFVAVALALAGIEGARRRPVAVAPPAVPAVAFPKPVAQVGHPLVTFEDPRASVVTGNPSPYGTALVESAAAQTR